MKRIAAIALLLFTPCCFADDLAIQGTTQVQPYRLVILKSSFDLSNKYAVWHVTPAANVDRQLINGSLIFVAPPGTYDVTLSVIDFDKKTGYEANTQVMIAGAPPVPPNPNPNPNPTDPLTVSLQTAYTADTQTDKAVKLAAYISAIRQSLPSADDTTITTFGQFRNILVAATTSVLTDTDLPSTRKAVQAYLEAKLGTQSNSAINRQLVKDTFNAILTALSGVK